MSATTGPIAAAGAIVVGNAVLLHGKDFATQQRVIVGTVIAGAGLALWEHAMPRTATAFSWLVLMSVLLVRTSPTVPAPLESLNNWLQNGSPDATTAAQKGTGFK